MRIVFMGTPDFAVGCLDAIMGSQHEVVGVFTQPDKPVGRKKVLTPPAVKVAALNYGLEVFQPINFKTNEGLEILQNLKPDICVVVAYGKILPKSILEVAKFGCINVHASILPKLRGASPIQWSIVTGEKETGVSIMQLDEGMDTGDVLSIEKCDILDSETHESLLVKLGEIGSKLLVKTLDDISQGKAVATPQDHSLATYAPIIKKEDGLINWNKSAKEIDCLIRGLHFWPVAYTMLEDKRLKILSANVYSEISLEAGRVQVQNKQIFVGCGSGAIEILELQLEGSKPMNAKSFLNGRNLDNIIL